MAGRGRIPKPQHMRAGHHKRVQSPVLPPEKPAPAECPELPGRHGGWHAAVVDWWATVWASPMASQWLQADVKGGLFLLALLHQDLWSTSDPKVRLKVAAEIRIQEARYGLSPADRRRLGWEVPLTPPDDSGEKQPKRRGGTLRRPARDPRDVLRAV